MAVLEKIRTKFGLAASIIIALGLLSFIIDPSSVESAMQSMSSKFDVGEINGKAVSYTDFQNEVDKMTTINEIVSGSSAQGAQQQDQIRNAVWQDLVYRNLFVKKAREAGINVGEEELVDLTSGSNLSPLIAQNPAFAGENGLFSKEQFLQFVRNVDSDETGRLRLYWNYIQQSILNQQYFEKYSSLFTAAASASPLMLKRSVADNNTTADVDYVMVPFGYAQDSTIVVSDKEIKDFYNSHKKFFKQQASRDIEYVVYEVVPSAKDIEAAKTGIADLSAEFAAATNMKSFLLKNSDRPYSEYWNKKGELNTVSSAIESFVWEGKGEISDIITAGNKFYIARVMESKNVPDSVFVKHILLQGADESKADSLVNVISKGANFANVAALHSSDQNSSAEGVLGNIGWMTQNYMIPGFESVITAQVNKPYVIKTQYGTHVVVVSKQTKPVAKKKVAILEKEALASKETFSGFYVEANKFATLASGSYANYRKAVDSLSVYSHPVNNMLEGANRLGSIDNTKEVTRWVYDNKAGKVSNIITVDNNYFIIATVKNIHKEGYTPVSEVSQMIRQRLYDEKLSEKKVAEVAGKIAGIADLNAVAETLGASVTSQSGVAFSSRNSQGIDPAFLGAISSAKEGEISAPVAGAMGVYVFKVNARNTGEFFTEADAKSRSSQETSYMVQTIIPVMMQDADVKDNRARFF